MKLTTHQIQALFRFKERHYVGQYNLKTELVGHLATGIEERLERNPNQVFEQVLNDVYDKFVVMGFNNFVY